jgi:cell division protein FtsB
MPVGSGDRGVSGESRVTRTAREKAARNARRRWLTLFAVVVLVVAAIGANIKPLTHFQDASARLDNVAAKVGTLKQQNAQLQSQLARLSETEYLETLARQQMAYVRPGEDLYIVTGASDDATTGSTGTLGAVPTFTAKGLGAGIVAVPGSRAVTGTAGSTAGVSDTGTSQTSAQTATEKPGFFERVISAIRGIF